MKRHSAPLSGILAAAALALPALAAPPAAGEETDSITVGEFTFHFGEPWIRQQASSAMRAGQFTYEHEGDDLEDVELIIFYFGEGQGGAVQANIDRWIGMFDGTPETQVDEKEIGDRKLIYLVAKGTYMESIGGPFSGNQTPRPDYTMLAAILPSPRGDVYLRVTGPHASVEAMHEAFNAFAESAFED